MKAKKSADESIFFSVVIPLYNKEKHIQRTLDSVLSQAYGNFEIIIVDDGSSDNSVNEVKKNSDPRIKLERQPNSGVSAARNKGIKLAKYDYIGFLDADDSWDTMFLETIKQLVISYPNAGAYATGYKYFNKTEGEIIPKSVSLLGEKWEGILDDYFKYAIIAPIITASSVVIPKKVLKELGGFIEYINRGEDLEMWCRIALKYPIAFNSNIYATYFIDSDNRACKSKRIIEKSIAYYSEDILNACKKEKNATIYFKNYMHKMIINKAYFLFKEGNLNETRRLLKRYGKRKFMDKKYWSLYFLSVMPQALSKSILDKFEKLRGSS